MVRTLHEAGIEVILDVVYNHTAEGNHLGPTVSMRGIDNAAYYRLVDDDKRYYMDYTGTGNSLNVGHPHSLQLIMDSLRYWVTEMHVDGFRFDLASTLAREFYDVDKLSTFFELVQQDPTVSQVKLIAEPWDVGPGGYQVGNFPPQWTEWNGKYRDTVRDFWRGEPATLDEFAYRLTGSADLYENTARRPVASINFVIAHDGFTLRRPGVLQREAQRGQRRGQQRRRESQPVVELRCGGTYRRPRDQRAALPAAAQLPRHPAAVPRCSDDLPRRRTRPHAGRQQQRVLPGQRDHLDRLGRRGHRPARLHQVGLGPARRSPGVPAAAVLQRQARRPTRPGRPSGHRLVHPRGHRDDRRGLGFGLRQVGRRLPQRPGHPRPRRAEISGSSTIRSCCASTRTTRTSSTRCRQRNSLRRGDR